MLAVADQTPPPLGLPSKNLMCIEKILCPDPHNVAPVQAQLGFKPPPPWAAK